MTHLQALHLGPLYASDEKRFAGFYTELLGASASSLEALDAWEFVPLSNDNDSDSTATSPSMPEHREDLPVQKKKPKSTSQRQREELNYLRTKVDELEGTLKTLKSTHSVTVAQRAGDHGDALGSLWEQAAKRQLDAKKRAEQENNRLREQLSRQIKFAKSLERTLRKRKIWEILQESKQQRLLEINATDSSILAMLKHNMSVRTCNVNLVFETMELKRATARRSMNYLEPEIVVDPLNGMRIDFTRNVSIPFGVHKISDVVWNLLQMRDLELSGLDQNVHILEQTDDILVMKQSMVLTVANVSHYTSSHMVIKRVVEENRVLLLWETLKEIRRSPSSKKADVQVLVKGCALLVETSNMSTGSATAGQTWVCVMPTMALPFTAATVPEKMAMKDRTVEPQHNDGPGLLTELIISSFEQNMQLMLQFLENVLFDDLTKGAVGSM
uniref:Uncharacterized protein n=1 Tax=Globisporangium ultimum (strain ATCC 200006 / CBS 805.95 / DAOM BR144) TaxID=431595 RepID=K3W9L1_GLOUD